MDRYIIYITYDEDEYINLFTLICRSGETIEKKVGSIEQTEIEDLFDLIESPIFGLSVVAEPEGTSWDHEKELQKRGIRFSQDGGESIEDICSELKQAMDRNFDIADISVIFSGRCARGDAKIEPVEPKISSPAVPLPKEEKPKEDDITELARLTHIILEKGL